MGRRNPLLTVLTVDPDKQPELARREGVRLYNAAIVEAAGRRVLIQGTDEAEIAIGIQRVLRTRSLTVCFLEGHGEFSMDGFEFHTHLEGVANHSHGEASSQIIETAGHGVGRLRRVLEAQGYVTRKLVLATSRRSARAIARCSWAANPRTTFLPAESAALRSYLDGGGNALLMFDLGFVPEAGLCELLSDLGVRLEQQVVVDPLSHYHRDAEMVAVTGYDPHPITRTLSLTFFPGIRPLDLDEAGAGRGGDADPPEQPRQLRPSGGARGGALRPRAPSAPATQVADVRPRVLGIAAEGTLAPGASPFRAVVIGDGDFASNSFLPYMSNSDLVGGGGALAGPRGAGHRRPHPHPRAADDPADGRAKPLALHLHRHPAAAGRDRGSAAWSGGGGDERGPRCGALPCRCLPCWRWPISRRWW